MTEVWVLAIDEGMDGPGVWVFSTQAKAEKWFMTYFHLMFAEGEGYKHKSPIPTEYVDYIIDDWMREEGDRIQYSISWQKVDENE